MFKKEKKITVHELIQQLKALNAFGVDIYEATIEVNNNFIRVEDKEKTANLYVNDDMLNTSVHIYLRK